MNEAVGPARVAMMQAEEDVRKYLKSRATTYASTEDLLSKYRCACEKYVFLDFEAATQDDAEGHLWATHGKINNKFRAQLAKFREGEGKKKVVEKRKLEKHYLDFVKASMRFYRGYIQRLASRFADVPEILQISHKFNLDTLSADAPIRPSRSLQKLLIQSCHTTLIRLGDLSRYRETELQQKERNWGPARGYYDLATAVDPTSGTSYNQLAVIARNDGDHLRALYYLYRAIAVKDPHPLAGHNLEKEFIKIQDQDAERALIPVQDAGRPGSGLQAWFVAFHANCAKNIDSERRTEQEREFLSQLGVDLKERPLDATLSKFVLINIAAEYLARQRDEEGQTNSALTTAYLTFNLKVFFVLLGILVSEFANLNEAAGQESTASDGSEKMTAVVRRVLPALRHYSSWLRSSASSLHRQTDETVVTHVREFWKRYAEALTVLTTTLDMMKLPLVDYLLEEDLDTVAFTPFATGASTDRYRKDDKPRPMIGDAGVQRLHPNQEMLARARGLVVDGVQITVDDGKKSESVIPIKLIGDRFEYRETHLIAESLSVPHGQSSHSHTPSAASVTREDIEQAKRQSVQMPPPDGIREDFSESASASVSTAMHHMIDGLVDSEMYDDDSKPVLHLTPFSPEESSSTPKLGTIGASSGTAWGKPHQQQNTLTAEDLATQMLHSPNTSEYVYAPNTEREETVRQPIHSSCETPFTPFLDESDSLGSRPTTAQRVQPDTSTPVPLSSGSAFQQDIFRRQQQLQMHSTPVPSCFPTSSWSYQESPVSNQLPPLQSSPWTASPPVSLPSSHFHGDEVPRKAPPPAMFGAIGQTPPSAQAG